MARRFTNIPHLYHYVVFSDDDTYDTDIKGCSVLALTEEGETRVHEVDGGHPQHTWDDALPEQLAYRVTIARLLECWHAAVLAGKK